MSLDKYQQAWKAEASQVQVTFDTDALSKHVQQSHEAFRSMIFRRHVGVGGASLSLIPVCVAMGIVRALPWTWYLSVPLLLWIAGFMLVTLRHYSQRQIEPGEPLLFCAKESLAQVEHQIWLMQSSFYWNLLPTVVCVMAYFIHESWEMTHSWCGFIIVAVIPLVFLILVYRWIYRMNQLAVRKELEPRRSDLRKLIASLENENCEEDASRMRGLVS